MDQKLGELAREPQDSTGHKLGDELDGQVLGPGDIWHPLTSPIGQATSAKRRGQGFFEIQLKVGTSRRDFGFWKSGQKVQATPLTQAGTLAAIEAVGWRLEHVDHVFVVTSETGRNKILWTGQQTAVSGDTMGFYLFRNAN